MMKFCLILILLLCAASTFINISDGGIFGSSSSSVLSERSRRLLQTEKPNCPVNFKFQNYTIITSKCKSPRYLPELCCPALKEFMCPFTQYLHEYNDCVSTMWDYINLYGEYSPDLFSRLCRGPMQDLQCPPLPPAASSSQSDNANNSNTIPPAASSQSGNAANSSNTITVHSTLFPLLMLPIATLQFIIM